MRTTIGTEKPLNVGLQHNKDLTEIDAMVNRWFDRIQEMLDGIPFYKRKKEKKALPEVYPEIIIDKEWMGHLEKSPSCFKPRRNRPKKK